jgi:hypothetical protein
MRFRSALALALGIVSLLAAAVWAISQYWLPILPKEWNSRVLWYFVAFTATGAFLAALKNITEFIDKLMGGNDPTKRLDEELSAIAERRMQAQHWKVLHKQCQDISLKLNILQGAALPGDSAFTLKTLEGQWSMDCRAEIERLIHLDCLPEGDSKVRQEFAEADHWLSTIEAAADRLDQLVGECVTPRDLAKRLNEIQRVLHGLALKSNEMLKFIDARLDATLGNLDISLENARRRSTALRKVS